MKKPLRSALLCLCLAGGASFPAQAANYLYIYQTPLISVTAGLQTGRNVSIRAVQTSPTNIFAVTQVGRSLEASVYQYGLHNQATIVQITPATSFVSGY